METRFALKKHGCINEDGNIIEAKLIQHFQKREYAEDWAIKFVSNKNKTDYYICQQEYDGVYWTEIENTQREITV